MTTNSNTTTEKSLIFSLTSPAYYYLTHALKNAIPNIRPPTTIPHTRRNISQTLIRLLKNYVPILRPNIRLTIRTTGSSTTLSSGLRN